MFGFNPERGRDGLPVRPWVKDYLIPFGLVLFGALGLLGGQLPKWAIVVGISYLVFVAGLSLYPPVARLIRFVVDKGRFQRVARAYFPSLSANIGRLRQLLGEGLTNTPLYVLREVSLWDELKGRPPLVDMEHLETLRSWLSSLEGRVGHHKHGDFAHICQELSHLIYQYNRFCCQRLQVLQQVAVAGAVPEQRLRQLKYQWNTHRESHVTFVKDWANLSSAINTISGRRLCIDYYEPLGTLE